MRDIIKIAWRNLWRNKRRTFITAASIFFAIFFGIIMRSFQLGTYGNMIKQSIEAFTGYLQVQQSDFLDDPSIDNSFEYSEELQKKLLDHPNVKAAVPRLESFALASSGNQSKGVLVVGISPEKEKALSNPEKKLVRYRITKENIETIRQSTDIPSEIYEMLKPKAGTSYISEKQMIIEYKLDKFSQQSLKQLFAILKFHSDYLAPNDHGVLISNKLSQYLNISIGDSVILMGQGYHGASAAGVYPVRGIIQLPTPELDNKLVYMTLKNTEVLYGMKNKRTSIAINLWNENQMEATQNEISAMLQDNDLSIKNWNELMPTMKQQIEGDNVGGLFFLGILYMIVFFGIFGTVQMMLSERRREFGVMVAIGMKRIKLASILFIEMIFLALFGIISGMLVSTPIILYGFYNPLKMTGKTAQMFIDMGFEPVMPLAFFNNYFFNQAYVTLLMILVAIIFPIIAIKKMKIIDAIHG